MERDKLGELNALQSIALAVLASVLTALAVVYVLRLRRRAPSGPEPAGSTERAAETAAADRASAGTSPTEAAEVSQPAVSTVAPAQLPDHFSEDLIVPDLTHTGPEIVAQDEQEGQSPDGV